MTSILGLFVTCVILQSCCSFRIRSSCKDIFCHRNCILLPQDDSCGCVSNSPRVVGGKNTSLGQYPWMAIVYATDKNGSVKLTCGGSIITKRHVLTAGHCVVTTHLKLSHVRVGEHDLSSKRDCTPDGICAPEAKDIAITHYVNHEGYDPQKYYNDIALLFLELSIEFNLYVAPICLPFAKMFLSGTYQVANTTLDVAGWGITNIETMKTANVQQTVKVPLLSSSECQRNYQRLKIGKKRFCAGGVKGEDSCEGDSGGPLIGLYSVDDTPNKYIQLGIVSYGPLLCGAGIPALYTNVTCYLDWILDNLK